MSEPQPLTLSPPTTLDWSRPDTPVASNFGDIYFSTDGGLNESRTVFLNGCGLPEAWQKTERFIIGELGFGSGLNFLATWQMWDQTKPKKGHLHFVSIEKFPFDKSQLSKALSTWPEIAHYAEQLIQAWPGRGKGFHRLHFGDISLTLIHDDIDPALKALNMKANAWFLDGFSPNKNPAMWSPNIMQNVANLSAAGARLASFTVAGHVRQALTNVGFNVERKEGYGRKRHRLEAQFGGKFEPFHYETKPGPLIIGAGIGGMSLARAFLRRGIKPRLIEDPSHILASGNAAALIKPRLDLQDRPESRFFLSSFIYALKQYEHSSLLQGVTQIAKSDKEALRYQKLCKYSPLSNEHLGLSAQKNLELPSSIVIDPQQVRQNLLSQIDIEPIKISNLNAIASPAFIAVGYGIRELIPEWPVRFSRGQVTWAQLNKDVKSAMSYGGYALPLTDGLLLGATHDRLVEGKNPYSLNPHDDEKNIGLLESNLNIKTKLLNKTSRASIRVTSADTLPVIGKLSNAEHFVLTGLGSRGFVFAPLLAEALASHYYGDPSPIEKAVWQKFSAKRLFN